MPTSSVATIVLSCTLSTPPCEVLYVIIHKYINPLATFTWSVSGPNSVSHVMYINHAAAVLGLHIESQAAREMGSLCTQ